MAPEIPGFCYWLPLYSSFYSFESNMSPRCRFVSSIKNSKTNNFVVKNCEFNIPFTLLLTTTLIINFIFSFNFRKSHYLWKFFRCEHFRNIRKSDPCIKMSKNDSCMQMSEIGCKFPCKYTKMSEKNSEFRNSEKLIEISFQSCFNHVLFQKFSWHFQTYWVRFLTFYHFA